MKGLIELFARNRVLPNLLMIGIIVAGFVGLSRQKIEIFPETALDMIDVTVPYPGAAPEEVEEGICIRIEEAIQDLVGIKKMLSTASEGSGTDRRARSAGEDCQ